MKKDTLLTLALILIGLSIVVITGTGCSTDNIGVGMQPESKTSADQTAYESATRPDVVLPEGLELVSGLSGKMAPTTVGNLDDPTILPRGGTGGVTPPTRTPEPIDNREPCVSIYVPANMAANVQCMYTGVSIPEGAVPHDLVVTACMPDEETAIVDFGPHPLQFNGVVQIWFDVSNLNYTDEEIESLQMWYVTEDESLEEISMNFNYGNMRAMGRTNHFSRYILTKTTLTN